MRTTQRYGGVDDRGSASVRSVIEPFLSSGHNSLATAARQQSTAYTNMKAQDVILAYKQTLEWSEEEAIDRVYAFLDAQNLMQGLRRYLRDETGVDPFSEHGRIPYMGKEYAVLAFSESRTALEDAAERVDTDTEVFALEAFAELLGRTDLEEFVIVQFSPNPAHSRELLRYDRRTSVGKW